MRIDRLPLPAVLPAADTEWHDWSSKAVTAKAGPHEQLPMEI
jgi:hypothetical protein